MFALFISYADDTKENVRHSFASKNKSPNEIRKFGYITNKKLTELGISDDRIAVYLPLSSAFFGKLLSSLESLLHLLMLVTQR